VAAVIAADTGDDTAARAARQRLAPLLAGIGDSFLHAVCQLAMAWTLPVSSDYDGALREVAVSLEELRGQDEPVYTAIAAAHVGTLEINLGRYDEALRHLSEARDLAERSGADWLLAAFPVHLGILAVLRGSLDEALDLSLAVRSTSLVTLCLAAYAQLALAEGDPQRAAQLKGAADGLRQRVGLAVPAAAGGRASHPDPPEARRQPVRSGVLCRLPAHPTASSRHRPGPAQHRHPDTLSRYAQ
jgi:tetratricopeptide (TPR) repeat protein